jgi:hypothetical protein
MMKTTAITRALLRDREAERPAQPQSAACFACGRSFMYRRAVGDDSGRFCSRRCRETYDAGLPAYDANYVRRVTQLPLASWRVAAGPPEIEIGSQYYAFVLDRSVRRKHRRKVSSGLRSINSNFVENSRAESISCEAA